MEQKCSILNVMKIFFEEPTSLHFIREIGKKINLSPTSVRNNIKELLKNNLIIKKESNPFDGYVANREDENFIFYKRTYNFYSLKKLKEYLDKNYSPKLAVVFGSYSLGEDRENSDIDLLVITQGKKNIDLERFEKQLKREINLIAVNDLRKIDKPLREKIYNGFVVCGGFDE